PDRCSARVTRSLVGSGLGRIEQQKHQRSPPFAASTSPGPSGPHAPIIGGFKQGMGTMNVRMPLILLGLVSAVALGSSVTPGCGGDSNSTGGGGPGAGGPGGAGGGTGGATATTPTTTTP